MYTMYLTLCIWAAGNLLYLLVARWLDSKSRVKRTKSSNSASAAPALAVISAIIFPIIGMAIAWQLADGLPSKTVVTSIKQLAAMRSSDRLTGSIFLGCGNIQGQPVYNIYVRNQDGSMSPDSVWVDSSTRIIEDKNLHDQGFWKVIQVVKDKSGPRANWAIVEDDGVLSSSYEFDVPVGTVIQNFSLK